MGKAITLLTGHCLLKDSWFQRYLLPGFIFQSTIIAGAYGSGRELAEFFLPFGPRGGLLGMLVTTIVFSLVLAATFEYSRRFQLFDYRSFMKKLLGPAWPLYEVLYLLLMILIISVIGASAGEMLRDTFHWPVIIGIIAIMLLIGVLVFLGTKTVERFFAIWSFVLYAAYIIFFGWNLAEHSGAIATNLATIETKPGWLQSGLAYAGYNIALVPVLLFCIRHLHTRREAVTAGLLGGPIAMIPAMLFYVAMIGQYQTLEGVGDAVLPVTVLLDGLSGAGLFIFLFPIVLFGTFVETGTAMIHGVNERIDRALEERDLILPRWVRAAVALVILLIAIVLADTIGLTALVARGYGVITYGFLLIFVLPIMTIGVWQISRR